MPNTAIATAPKWTINPEGRLELAGIVPYIPDGFEVLIAEDGKDIKVRFLVKEAEPNADPMLATEPKRKGFLVYAEDPKVSLARLDSGLRWLALSLAADHSIDREALELILSKGDVTWHMGDEVYAAVMRGTVSQPSNEAVFISGAVVLVASSNVHSLQFKDGTLTIGYKNGGRYCCDGVSLDTALGILKAASVGKALKILEREIGKFKRCVTIPEETPDPGSAPADQS
jgi:hypothetical protein